MFAWRVLLVLAPIPIVGCDSDDDSDDHGLDAGTREVQIRDAAVRGATDAGDAAVVPHQNAHDAGHREAGETAPVDICGRPSDAPAPAGAQLSR